MAAARNFLQVRYVRLPELLTDLVIARGNGTFSRAIQQYKKPALLILDEWLLYPLKDTETRDLLEIAEARYKKASTIFCSQFDVPGWRGKIGDLILADAICDRIVHNFLQYRHRLQGIHAKTQRRQGKRRSGRSSP